MELPGHYPPILADIAHLSHVPRTALVRRNRRNPDNGLHRGSRPDLLWLPDISLSKTLWNAPGAIPRSGRASMAATTPILPVAIAWRSLRFTISLPGFASKNQRYSRLRTITPPALDGCRGRLLSTRQRITLRYP